MPASLAAIAFSVFFLGTLAVVAILEDRLQKKH